jgi:hypothetical protein
MFCKALHARVNEWQNQTTSQESLLQTARVYQRESYNVILEKGKQLGSDEAAHTEPKTVRKRHTSHRKSRIRWLQQWMQQCQKCEPELCAK